MKFLTWIGVFALGVAGFYLLFPPALGLLNTQQFDKVVVKVKGNPKELRVTSKASSKCKKRPNRPGCIEVEEGHFAHVPVRMGIFSSWKWHLETFEICVYDTTTPTGKRDLNRHPKCATLTDKQAADFKIAVQGGSKQVTPAVPTGTVDLTALDSGGSISGIHGFDINNFNKLPGEYFYRIKACRDDDRKICLWTDPPITNKGRGSG